jgi:hypothetical protein
MKKITANLTSSPNHSIIMQVRFRFYFINWIDHSLIFIVLRKIGVAPTDGEVVREHDG